MTIAEIRDYLAQYCGEGKGDSPVFVCDSRDNPHTDGVCIADIVFIETRSGDCKVVLQTD
jgi:hypothetical protein